MTGRASGDRQRDGYLLSTDRARVDLERVHAWLSQESYWAAGRSPEVVERSIAGALPYSVFHTGEQVAFARVVTDGATFAWICDVFVANEHRGRGLGRWIVSTIVDDLTACGVLRFVLVTRDAHEVYRSCGFSELAGPDRWMEIDRRPASVRSTTGTAAPGG